MVKVLFGDHEIDIGEGKFLPILAYCRKFGVTKPQVLNWADKGYVEEGKDFFHIPDLEDSFIRDQDFRQRKQIGALTKYEIAQMYKKGVTISAIAKKKGLSRGTVNNMLKRAESTIVKR